MTSRLIARFRETARFGTVTVVTMVEITDGDARWYESAVQVGGEFVAEPVRYPRSAVSTDAQARARFDRLVAKLAARWAEADAQVAAIRAATPIL